MCPNKTHLKFLEYGAAFVGCGRQIIDTRQPSANRLRDRSCMGGQMQAQQKIVRPPALCALLPTYRSLRTSQNKKLT
jgi:hypothetical protein